ncbi:MAG TPA: DEAD/DEAH box helicase [Chloroflexia bacterium]|nr:DEAD/DEAH box helicase [Chloroflexia bacterium]
MNLTQLLDHLQTAPYYRERITAWHEQPARDAVWAPFPATLHPHLVATMRRLGYEALYSHQAAAVAAAARGESLVVVTPTASGKTLCYNLPVLDAVLRDPQARALYLFPTKALAQDQLAGLHGLITALEREIKTYTYDGDTPANIRQVIRRAGHVVISNPDMLHTGILPHHTKWVKLFENLRFIVVDEVHHYRGVFGSHVANVLRRLLRISRFYGANPQFICASATIANPRDLACRVTGAADLTLVDTNGAPAARKIFALYNPPLVHKELGLRRSALLETSELAGNFLANDVQTIVFARSRTAVEILLTYLRTAMVQHRRDPEKVRGYRGGYLPLRRREIERGLRDGTVRAVVSTNALELGIDIGSLETCIMAGYPGTIASTWQQAGRAGRRSGASLALLVAGSSPLDQFLVQHPEYFFARSPEHGLINPDNLLVLMQHIQCAAFELPFADGERYGSHDAHETALMLGYLADSGVLHHSGEQWHWSSENFPAENVSLRTAAADNFVIIDTTDPTPRVIGEMDRFSVPTLLHEEAIYLHEGVQYHVDKLDWDEQKGYVRQVEVDYYTDANLAVTLKVLDVLSGEDRHAPRSHGEVMVSALATIYKKIKLHTHENIGWGRIHLPEQEMHSTAYWLTVPLPVAEDLPKGALQGALVGLAHGFSYLAPLYLMCDPHDLGVVPQVKSPFTEQPTIFIYDSYAGGIGFSKLLYTQHARLLAATHDLIAACGCESGCPSCVGAAAELGDHGKQHTLTLLRGLQAIAAHLPPPPAPPPPERWEVSAGVD